MNSQEKYYLDTIQRVSPILEKVTDESPARILTEIDRKYGENVLNSDLEFAIAYLVRPSSLYVEIVKEGPKDYTVDLVISGYDPILVSLQLNHIPTDDLAKDLLIKKIEEKKDITIDNLVSLAIEVVNKAPVIRHLL